MPSTDNPFSCSSIYVNDSNSDDIFDEESDQGFNGVSDTTEHSSIFTDAVDECEIIDDEIEGEFNNTLPYTSTPVSHFERDGLNVDGARRRLFTTNEDDEVKK